MNSDVKTVNIDRILHEKLKKFCKKNKLKINEYISEIIEEKMTQTTKQKLPQILKNSEGEIVESITCSFLSPEYKNNMPKELTLIRNTQEGSGFVSNYIQK